MRYIKFKTVVTKTSDEIIDDYNTIKLLLTSLKDRNLVCNIRLEAGPQMPNSRILSVTDNDFVFQTMRQSSSLKKRAPISELDYLEVNTSDVLLAQNSHEISRWVLIEPDIDDTSPSTGV